MATDIGDEQVQLRRYGMNVYRVSCYSKCGSYFASYLQSVTVTAETEGEAIVVVQKWLRRKGESFIYPRTEWRVLCLVKDVSNDMVIDCTRDSDY